MGKDKEVHVIVVPCPAQGHINPLLQFSKLLSFKGLNVTFSTIFDIGSTHLPFTNSLTIDQISLLPYHGTEPEDPKTSWGRRQTSIRLYLTELIARHESAGNPIACVVYDSVLPWVLDIVKKFGVLGASFFTQSCAVNAIYYNVHKGWLDVPLQKNFVSFDGFPILHNSDLPSFVFDLVNYPSLLTFMTDQFSRLNEVDWIFVNTFDCLEQQEVNWMGSQYPFKNIGPMVPSMYLDGKLKEDRDYGLSLCDQNMDSTMNWIHSKPDNSLIYVSFGSTAELGKDQMDELAMALKLSNKFFLWVVRESEIQKLPKNFIEETFEKGMVVNWCPQLEVLDHKSIGCFITHCGWNSTLEALSLGVPMVAMPQWTDQPTNAKYVEDVWKVGRRVKVDEDLGIAKREQIQLSINEVMEGESSKEVRENLRKWKELAKQTMDEHGNSNNNINEFVEKLMSKQRGVCLDIF